MKRTLSRFAMVPYLLAVSGLLAACDARYAPLADYRSGQPKATAWREPSGAQSTPVTPRRQAAAKPASQQAAPASGPVVASTALPGPVEDSGDVALVGLNMQQTRDRLGAPTEEIEQAPAKVWRYRTTQCSLDVAMYPDVQTQVFRVLNYEVKGNDGTEQGRRKCLSGLRSGALNR
ncbi:MAG: hypothetical protein KG075_21720 [Alphaproteobacteria bacterium]|nr:hypothetical protein [Alphaproteobacteria bacterium]